MRILRTAITVLAMTTLVTCFGAASASAREDPGTVSGQKFGAKDGHMVTTESYPVSPGQAPITVTYGSSAPSKGVAPMAVWGSSYATSSEFAEYIYTGRAKAAGNVYAGKRIIKVCIWYSYPGGTPSPTVCSSATSSGSSWRAGSEKSVTFFDHPSANWPQTTFHITTTRINPAIV